MASQSASTNFQFMDAAINVVFEVSDHTTAIHKSQSYRQRHEVNAEWSENTDRRSSESVNKLKGIEMLSLTRKQEQGIQAGDVFIKVLSVRGNKVRLGIKAPPEINIKRSELSDRESGSQEGNAGGQRNDTPSASNKGGE